MENTEKDLNEACHEEGSRTTAEKKEKKTDKKELISENEELKKALEEQKDKYLRMAAEYDNFRRRSREEKDQLYEIAVTETVAELLPMIDNLERASAFTDADGVKSGLLMIEKSVKEVLEKLGVEEYGKVGETFDPNIHNAVLHVEDDTLGDGEIVEIFQKGYKKGKHVIRFAMVKSAN